MEHGNEVCRGREDGSFLIAEGCIKKLIRMKPSGCLNLFFYICVRAEKGVVRIWDALYSDGLIRKEVSQASVTKHLKVLRDAGLVAQVKRGVYMLNPFYVVDDSWDMGRIFEEWNAAVSGNGASSDEIDGAGGAGR